MTYGTVNVDSLVSSGGGVIGPNITSLRNRIINGAMMIDQRNAGASVTAGSSYTLDRWNVDRVWSGSTVTIQQSSTAPAGFSNSMIATVSTGAAVSAANYFSIQQFIEGYNVADMGFGTANAQTFTVSFWVRSSVTGTFGVGFRNSAFDLSYWTTYTINAANTWEQKFVTIPGPTSGTWYTNNSYGLNVIFSLGCGSTNKAASNNAWNAGSKLGAVGETDLIATTGATFYITGVQLEKGSTATSFDYRPYGTELALCQRYYISYGGTSVYERMGVGMNNSSTTSVVMFTFPVEMRAAPTFGYSSASHFGIYNGSTVISTTALGADTPSTKVSTMLATVSTGLTGTAMTQFLANNSTSARATWSAEL
jgi:hypothetical protein